MSELRPAEEVMKDVWGIGEDEITPIIQADREAHGRLIWEKIEPLLTDMMGGECDQVDEIGRIILAVSKPQETLRERLGRRIYSIWSMNNDWPGAAADTKGRYMDCADAVLDELDKIEEES